MTVRVLLVDDQILLRHGLRMILDEAPDIDVVGEAGSGTQAIDAAAALQPDVILMDIRMPDLDGVAATSRIIAAHPDGDGPKIIMLTTFDLDEYVAGALHAGASGFLLKDATPDTIINGVHIAAAGDALLAPTVTRRLIDRFTSRREIAALAPPPGLDQLTDRERQVMQLVVRGMSNAEIAAELYLSETTVKTHVGRVLTKLAVRDRVQLVVLAYEHDLTHPNPPDKPQRSAQKQ